MEGCGLSTSCLLAAPPKVFEGIPCCPCVGCRCQGSWVEVSGHLSPLGLPVAPPSRWSDVGTHAHTPAYTLWNTRTCTHTRGACTRAKHTHIHTNRHSALPCTHIHTPGHSGARPTLLPDTPLSVLAASLAEAGPTLACSMMSEIFQGHGKGTES